MKLPIQCACLTLLLASNYAFADKIAINGAPVVLEQKGEIYYTPATYQPSKTYNYVTLNGTNRVCYATKQPQLASLDMIVVNVSVGGTSTVWNCYAYSPDYFVVTTP